MDIRDRLKEIIEYASEEASKKLGMETTPEVILELPKDKKLADLSTNIAMQLCKAKKGIKPLDIAETVTVAIRERLKSEKLDNLFKGIEVKPPGFINFHFSNEYLHEVIKDIAKKKSDFGKSSIGKGKKVLLEFVSANPTGPLSVAHGRQAAVGDVIANILEFAGYKVTKEYYLNDEGNQIILLGKSIHARYCELLGEIEAFPENGYKGKYIYDIAKALIEKHEKALIDISSLKILNTFCDFGVKYIMDIIKKELEDFGVEFDIYFSQRKLGKSTEIDNALAELKKKNFLYEKDGALWFKSTDFGDDKDRVLKKSDGAYTYITPDIAYHKNKFQRGFDWIIDLWGPDHHGYIARLKAACKALGKDESAVSLLIIQLATLSRGGIPVKMSTREGEFITLREVMNEVGKDVARFFFLMRRKDSHLNFDLELAKSESMENPVYYIQYAHARICGILEHKKEKGLVLGKTEDLSLLKAKEELDILRILREFPAIIEWSARSLEPQRLIEYLMELAAGFHIFYSKHRIINDDKALSSARLVLIESVKIVFSESLFLLGVSCPEKM